MHGTSKRNLIALGSILWNMTLMAQTTIHVASVLTGEFDLLRWVSFTFHQKCVGIMMFPPGDWHCPNCICKVCKSDGRRSGQGDDTAVSALLTCGLSKEKYHKSCGMNPDARPLKRNKLYISFCGIKCSKVLHYYFYCLMPRMLEVEEEGSDTDEKSFEAVTPEHEQPEIPREREATATSIATAKHHHILEDVDGELEMEDLAPSCEGDIDSVYISQGQYEQRLQLPFAPPLPEDRPPSPPPLPNSPPPFPSTSQSFPPPPPLPSANSFGENADSNYYANTSSLHNGLRIPPPRHPGTGNSNSLPSDTVHSHYYGYKDFVPPMQRPGLSSSSDPSCSFPGPPHTSVPTGNSVQHIDGAASLHNKNYHLLPPPPMLSNHFSYVQADQRVHSWMDASSSSFTKRFQFGHDMHRNSNQERIQHEIDERCRLPPPPIHPGTVHSDNSDSSYAPASYYGPPDAIPNREWSYPPRSSKKRSSSKKNFF